MDYQYVVIKHWADDPPERFSATIMLAAEIFNMMDNADSFPCELELEIWRINGITEGLTECAFYGPWHDGENPLKMCIVGDGIKEIGYATDH